MEATGLIVTITLALTGYFVTYFNNLRLTKRADRLKLITTQIDELYGTLYVITQAGKILFKASAAKHQRHTGTMLISTDMPVEDIKEWVIWVEKVLQPMNEQLEQVIIRKAHLIIETEMPECLKQFWAHSASYKAVIKKWQSGDFTERFSDIDYPKDINDYAERSYKELKNKQKILIGH